MQGIAGLATNPVISNSFAGLAIAAAQQATIEVSILHPSAPGCMLPYSLCDVVQRVILRQTCLPGAMMMSISIEKMPVQTICWVSAAYSAV